MHKAEISAAFRKMFISYGSAYYRGILVSSANEQFLKGNL
jgi:hypothetical protein